MDKGRHPHVVRTWTVERTKVPYRPPQRPKHGPSSREGFRAQEKNPPVGGSQPKRGQ